MVRRQFSLSVKICIIAIGLLATACSPSAQTPEPVTLKIAVLPILDALPMYVAQTNGYFDSEGVEVEFIPVSSAAERDQVMSAGQADGMINDLISTLLYNQQLLPGMIIYPCFGLLKYAESSLRQN